MNKTMNAHTITALTRRKTGNVMKSNKGFTLIETLIAMALIIIAVFIFTPIFAHSFKQIADAGVWQNIIIKQRASIEEQLAGRSAILSDDIKYPPIDITLNLYEEGVETSDISVKISGKNIKDSLTNKTNIRSFLTNIYQNEILSGSDPDEDDETNENNPEIIVSPKTIYYGEVLYKNNLGKTFTIHGVNLTFTPDSVDNISIIGNDAIDYKNNFERIYYPESNTVTLTVKSSIPKDFFNKAPFKIIYDAKYTTYIEMLLPQIIAVTKTGDFISGFFNNGNIEFSEIIGKIPSISGNVNQIVYNFQKREYVAVGDTNLCRVFEIVNKKPAWINKDTKQFSNLNNNYSISVDWLNNYMIGSSYIKTEKKGNVEVFFSIYSIDDDNTYALIQVSRTIVGKGNDVITTLDAKYFDFIRSTIFVETFNADNGLVVSESHATNYILAFGHFGVGYNDPNDNRDYDMLYAAKSYNKQEDAAWIDISSAVQGMPTNNTASSVKITGAASGTGRYEQSSGGTVEKSADFSILLACTDAGKIYGVSPSSAATSMIVPNNTNWKLVLEADSANLKSLTSIIYGNDVFVAVGNGSKNILVGTVKKNTDEKNKFDINIDWTSLNIDNADFYEVNFINEKFYAVGKLNDIGVIYCSTYGKDWVPLSIPEVGSITSIAGE